MRRSCAFVVAGILALALAACGGDDEVTPIPPPGPTGLTGPTGATGAGGTAEAEDAEAKDAARDAQVALERYFVDSVSYAGADLAALEAIDPSLPNDLEIDADATSYTITAPSESGNSFTIEGEQGATAEFTCTEPGLGGCPADADWSGG